MFPEGHALLAWSMSCSALLQRRSPARQLRRSRLLVVLVYFLQIAHQKAQALIEPSDELPEGRKPSNWFLVLVLHEGVAPSACLILVSYTVSLWFSCVLIYHRLTYIKDKTDISARSSFFICIHLCSYYPVFTINWKDRREMR